MPLILEVWGGWSHAFFRRFVEQGVHSYKSELWSLGVMLFELHFGHPPWTSDSLNELIRAILYDAPSFPADIPVSARAVS